MVVSCSSPQEKVEQLILDHLKMTVSSPEQFKIIEISKVDSTFGKNYFAHEELRQIFEITKATTNKIMSSTNGLSLSDADPAMMELFDRQMKATTEMRSFFLHFSEEKGRFSGYKIKIKYECISHTGTRSKALRWYFIDQDGKQVLRTFELPLM